MHINYLFPCLGIQLEEQQSNFKPLAPFPRIVITERMFAFKFPVLGCYSGFETEKMSWSKRLVLKKSNEDTFLIKVYTHGVSVIKSKLKLPSDGTQVENALEVMQPRKEWEQRWRAVQRERQSEKYWLLIKVCQCHMQFPYPFCLCSRPLYQLIRVHSAHCKHYV